MRVLTAVWQRPELRFVVVYLVILTIGFFILALNPVNEILVVPFTAAVARVAGWLLGLLGEQITLENCVISSPRFSVAIYNGCNGLITSLIFVAGIVSFPASIKAKLAGAAGGLLAIGLLNQVRIISLYYIGAFYPRLFSEAHTVVWQSIVILFGVAAWVFWAWRFGAPQASTSSS